MRFAVLPPYRTGVTSDPDWMAAFAREVEACGFEGLFTVEHVVVPSGYASRYPYAESGRMPLPEDVDIPDPLELLAFLAAHTERITLGTGILILPEHHPLQLAKRLATIDCLSGGRMVLGVGVGWMDEELEALGVDPRTRGRRCDEAIAALRTIWSEDEPTFEGEFFRFTAARSHPKPVQPTIPILIGGHSAGAARRAGSIGDGWFPLGLAGELLATRREQVAEAAIAAGRDPADVEITLGGLLDTMTADDIERLAGAGASRLVLSTRTGDLGEVCGQLHAFAQANIRG